MASKRQKNYKIAAISLTLIFSITFLVANAQRLYDRENAKRASSSSHPHSSTSEENQHDGNQSHDHFAHIQAYRKETSFVHNLPAPSIIEGIGTVNFPISTTSSSSQQFFNQGVALLHCFWDFEAYRAFKEAIRTDSSAIMLYWGLYSAIGAIEGNDFEGDKDLALRKMELLYETASPREQLYCKAILSRADPTSGKESYEKNMELLIHRYPDDVQAKLFLALSKLHGYDVDLNPREGTLYAEYLLKDILKTDSLNAAAHHYWIHLKENCCPAEALISAQKLPMLAPNSGHMVHMPGHIYYKLGEYKNAQKAFIEAVKTDSTYIKTQHIPEVDAWNFIHNINYLLANCAQNGDYATALYYARKLQAMPVSKARSQKYEGRFFYQGIIAPAKMELCFGNYSKARERLEAIQNPDSVYSPKAMAYRDALLFFAYGMEAISNEDAEKAADYANQLESHLWQNVQETADERKINNHRIKEVSIAALELRGRIALLNRQFQQAETLLTRAVLAEKNLGYSEPPAYARPVLLSLESLYTQQKNWSKVLEVLHQLNNQHPNSIHVVDGYIHAYHELGDKEKVAYYNELKQKL
ncbi:hypothetical protein RYH73_07465 [Olivibacter sp. CPCC 100613]|uniref:tetratricopeptide repeat protein n=1 Tax=Olivibacter sp. CPCC 100613 TaxID=3079931 RepID=UPI002FF48B52